MSDAIQPYINEDDQIIDENFNLYRVKVLDSVSKQPIDNVKIVYNTVNELEYFEYIESEFLQLVQLIQ